MLAGILLFLKQHVASEGHLAVLLKKYASSALNGSAAFERREPPDSRMEFVEVLRCRQIKSIVENLDALNFDSAHALIRRANARIVNGCVVVTGAGGGIDHRGEARSSWNALCLLECGGPGF